MPVQATLFSRLVQHLPCAVLDRAVTALGMDKGCRELDARSHLAAPIAAQLIAARGLGDIEAVLASQAPALKRRRLPACRSTLADANQARSPEAFEALLPALLANLSPANAREAKAQLRWIDSTRVNPGSGAKDWAHFQTGKLAAKVHVVYDPAAQVPAFHEIASGNTNAITVAKSTMAIEPGTTCAFGKKAVAHSAAGVRHALFHRIEVETLAGRIERGKAVPPCRRRPNRSSFYEAIIVPDSRGSRPGIQNPTARVWMPGSSPGMT